jgi:hypothetical protein
MASRLNSEFNYRYQIEGNTPWQKIFHLQNFLIGRKRAAALENVSELKYKAKLLELEHLKKMNALPHVILTLEAEIAESSSTLDDLAENFKLNKKEIASIEKVLKEMLEIAEPTRLHHEDGTPFTDDEMFEANAANEFTVMIAREIQAEIISTGRPSPAKLRNAMSNPHTFKALQSVGLIPVEANMIEGNVNPLQIELKNVDVSKINDNLSVLQLSNVSLDQIENKCQP